MSVPRGWGRPAAGPQPQPPGARCASGRPFGRAGVEKAGLWGSLRPFCLEFALTGLESGPAGVAGSPLLLGLLGLGTLCSCGVESHLCFVDTLLEVLSWVTGSSEAASNSNRLEQVRRAIEEAETAGVQEELLDTLRAKLEELEFEVRRERTVAVRDEETGATLAVIRSRSMDTLADMGEAVRQETGDRAHALHFVFRGQALDNSWTLAEAGVRDGDSVSLVRTALCRRPAAGGGAAAVREGDPQPRRGQRRGQGLERAGWGPAL